MPRCDELPFGRGQHPLKPDNQERSDQVRVDVSRPSAKEFLLKSCYAVADGRLDFPLGFRERTHKKLTLGPEWKPAQSVALNVDMNLN